EDAVLGVGQEAEDPVHRELVLEDLLGLLHGLAAWHLELQDGRPPDVLDEALRERTIRSRAGARGVRLHELELDGRAAAVDDQDLHEASAFLTWPSSSYSKKPRPVFTPRWPARTIWRRSGQGRYLKSPSSLKRCCIQRISSSRPTRSAR